MQKSLVWARVLNPGLSAPSQMRHFLYMKCFSDRHSRWLCVLFVRPDADYVFFAVLREHYKIRHRFFGRNLTFFDFFPEKKRKKAIFLCFSAFLCNFNLTFPIFCGIIMIESWRMPASILPRIAVRPQRRFTLTYSGSLPAGRFNQ